MNWLQIGLALLALGIWTTILLFRGGFWRERPRPAPANLSESWPEVVAVIPARNEADVVGDSMAALLGQDYPGRFFAILVDDDSGDGTAAVAARAAEGRPHGLTVVRTEPLPPGWTGKLWAVNRGLAEAERICPNAKYVLLTDADIRYAPASLRALVARAEIGGLKLVSLMVRLKTATLAERALIPAYVFFFQKLYPFAWIRDPNRRLGAAAGGCMLVDRAALRAIGGIAAIRSALIDDCALGQAIKRQGPIWLGLADDVASLRGYPRWADVWMLIARSAFTQLGFSTAMLVMATLGMLATYLLPPLLALIGDGWPRLIGAAAWAAMLAAYQPILHTYRLSPLWALALPLVALFYAAATVDSAIRYWSGRGGAWKGRLQAQGPARDPASAGGR